MPASDAGFNYPTDEALRHHLIRLFRARGAEASDFVLVSREPLEVSRTHPSERVICAVDGRNRDICCKYGGHSDAAHVRYGHRHGIAYEAAVYDRLLSALDVTVPGFLGAVEETGPSWLVMEFFDGSTTVTRSGSPEALAETGRWLGDFHRQAETLAASAAAAFLFRHSAVYYRACAERTLEFAALRAKPYRWLGAVARRYMDEAVPALSAQQTVIHGEFYSSNVLYRSGVVVPVDWESAAIGAPEIDLAFLLERWPEEEGAAVVEAYVAARWTDGAPADFFARLDWARMFSQFRWLGDRKEWTLDPENRWRFEILRQYAI